MKPFSLYRGQLSHSRSQPVAHSFNYKVFQLWININRLQELNKISRWWSTSRFNLVRFNRRNHLPSDKPLLQEVYSVIDAQTGKNFAGEVFFLGNLSYWGHCYNPASFYACYQDDVLCFLICEIHNTPWGERFCYVHDLAEQPEQATYGNKIVHIAQFNKGFHVSPFMPMDLDYEWRYMLYDESIRISMSLFKDDQPIFNATLNLKGETLTRRTANRLPFLYPFMCIKTISAIYWQALKLFIKRVPFHPYPRAQKVNSPNRLKRQLP